MTTLKKILSVVLALAMVLGMTAAVFADDEVVEAVAEAPAEELIAPAEEAEEVTPVEVIAPAPVEAEEVAEEEVVEEIVYREALDVIGALNIVVSEGDELVDYADNLTRGQAAKFIAYLMLGQEKSEALEAKDVFEVLADEWDSKYIAYCTDANIVHGHNESIYDAQAPVTGLQFGKMILGCLGYDAKIEGLVGEGWDNATALLMKEAGLTEGLAELREVLSLEEASQMAFNAIKATCVEYVEGVATPVAVAKNVFESIYNDDQLQLGEKLFGFLALHVCKGSHTWTLGKEVIGTYKDEVEEEVSDAPAIDESRTYPLVGTTCVLANPEVLFSTEADGFYTPYLAAHPGQPIYVKANRFTLDLLEMFNGSLPEIVVSKTENAFDKEAEIDYVNLFHWVDFKQVFEDVQQQKMINTLKMYGKMFRKDYTIELKLVSEAEKAGEAATYMFYMPDRWVSTRDFEVVSLQTVTFFNRTLLPRTLFVKYGDLGKVQKLVIKPFKSEKIEVKPGEVLTVSSIARPTKLFTKEVKTGLVYKEFINANQLYILKGRLAKF